MRLDATAYLAPRDLEPQLRGELKGLVAEYGRLFLAQGPPQSAYWAQNIWKEPRRLQIRSVADGARQLRDLQRNWALYSFHLHRRAKLIQEKLPHVSSKPLEFPQPAPTAPLGSWTLLDEETILAAPSCSSPFPNGEARFVEHKAGPPNRAYLKLWEGLTLIGRHPGPGERCLDAGASPGGWTWGLARLGSSVLAVDRAPLDPAVAGMPGVEYRQGSAFAMDPGVERFDWVFSDVVCYPERLWRWVQGWLEAEAAKNIFCTVKFQGQDHYGPIRNFASISGSRLMHLHHNKHELTWFFCRESARAAEPRATSPDAT